MAFILRAGALPRLMFSLKPNFMRASHHFLILRVLQRIGEKNGQETVNKTCGHRFSDGNFDGAPDVDSGTDCQPQRLQIALLPALSLSPAALDQTTCLQLFPRSGVAALTALRPVVTEKMPRVPALILRAQPQQFCRFLLAQTVLVPIFIRFSKNASSSPLPARASVSSQASLGIHRGRP
jgi:hypothetical protein